MQQESRRRRQRQRWMALAITMTSATAQAAWVKVANEWATFQTSGATVVRFGAGSQWIQKTVSGPGTCDRFFFGSDPAYGLAKTCEADVQATTPDPGIAPSSSTTPTVAALPATIAAGSGYAVDAVQGNDANPGTPSAPFRTLSRLRSVVLASGQGIYLRCGSVWRESLDLGATQLRDNTVIAPYGSNCNAARPRITGANAFNGSWVKSGNIWSRKLPTSTPRITRLFVGGEPMRLAQWPNASVAMALSQTSTQATIVASASDRAALSGKSIVGATVQTRSAPWWIDAMTISSYDAASGTMRWSGSTRYPQQTGQGYVLQNKLWMLDAPGEFFHDTSTGTLYVYPSSASAQSNLNGTTVEAAVRNTAVTLRDRAGLRMSGVRVDMANDVGVLLSQTSAAVLDQMQIAHHGDSGVRIQARSGAAGRHAVRRSEIRGNADFGIDAASAANVDVVGNVVSDTGTIAWTGMSTAAIWSGDNALIDDNVVKGTAYKGIRVSGTEAPG